MLDCLYEGISVDEVLNFFSFVFVVFLILCFYHYKYLTLSTRHGFIVEDDI